MGIEEIRNVLGFELVHNFGMKRLK